MRQIIFDLDDTLYKSEKLRASREKAILDFLGEKNVEYEMLKKSRGTIESFRLLGFEKREFFELMNGVEINLEKDERLIKIFERLNKTFRVVVLSNSSKSCVRQTLEKLGILHLIDEYYSSEDFDEQKPSIECFSMIEKGDICVGDNFKKDLSVPKKLGAVTIHLGDSSDADFRINNIYELEELLDKF
jgi:HAD superfamily hydrolase (TIGR01549 family)